MKLDEITELARKYADSICTGGPGCSCSDANPVPHLAAAVLAMAPVVEAAKAWEMTTCNARGCESFLAAGCPVADALDALRSALSTLDAGGGHE